MTSATKRRTKSLEGNQHAMKHGAFSARRPTDDAETLYRIGQAAREAMRTSDYRALRRQARALRAYGQIEAASALRAVANIREDEIEVTLIRRRHRWTRAELDSLASIAAGVFPKSTSPQECQS